MKPIDDRIAAGGIKYSKWCGKSGGNITRTNMITLHNKGNVMLRPLNILSEPIAPKIHRGNPSKIFRTCTFCGTKGEVK